MANKQIKDFDLKESIDGLEDLLIQDSDGITKRIKTSKLMGNLDLSNYYTKAEVDDLLANTDLSIDMADYYDKATIDNLLAKKANVSHTHTSSDITDLSIPTKISELQNDSGFISEIPSEYINETELNNALANKANTSDIPSLAGYATKDDLNTKADKSEIPSLEGYATETFVTNKIAEASLSGGEVDLSGLATKTELATKADKTYVDEELAKKANESHTHSYNDLTDKPTIPSIDGLATKKELTDGLATKANVSHTHDQYLTEHQDLSDYALKTELPTVPTKVSELANDSGFIKSIPSEYVTETELNAKGYLTSHQDISGLQTKTDNNLTTTSKEVVGAINEVKDMADLILDTEVRIDKTYSSSKIYQDIQQCLNDSKTFTLLELGKFSGVSYKIVASTSEMTSESIIYLIANENTYDMYIVEENGATTKIGDMDVDLSQYYTKTEIDNDFLKKVDADGKYATITTVDGKANTTDLTTHTNDTDIHVTTTDKAKWNKVIDKVDTTDFDALKTKVDEKANTSDIPTKVSELTNDSNYQTAKQVNSAVTTEIAKVETELKGNIKEINDSLVDKAEIDDTSTSALDATWSASKIYSAINSIGAHEVDTSHMSGGILNVMSIKQSFGVGCYEILGQGDKGHGSIRLNIWQVVSDATAFSCCITDTIGVRSICSNEIISTTVDVGISCFNVANKIIKIF